MKRWNYLAALMALLLLSGCGASAPEAENGGEVPAQAQTTPAPSREATALSSAQTEAQARPITDEEILAAYARAVEAYSWFDLAALPSTGAPTLVDGWEYYLVDAPGLTDLNDLGNYLRSLFSEELTEQLLATGGDHPLYLDVDGALYTTAGARGADIYKGAITTAVDRGAETAYSVNVTVETLAADLSTVTGLECWSFPYELTGDRWVFTSFDLVY
ncbi:MAG: hypothetical protein RR288_03985 [Oscillibacter sp.]